jgi:hypothetical protein
MEHATVSAALTDPPRRAILALAGLAITGMPARRALAHHGWSSFDQDQPIYLEGIAREVRWRNPHAELMLEVQAPLVLPIDLPRRPIPPQSAPIDSAQLLAKTRLPAQTAGRWEIELAPIFRLSQWQVPEVRNGAAIAVVGFALRESRPIPLMRVEYLFLDSRAYPMRSSPA